MSIREKVKLALSFSLTAVASSLITHAVITHNEREVKAEEYQERQYLVELNYNGRAYILPLLLDEGFACNEEDRESRAYLREKAKRACDRLSE